MKFTELGTLIIRKFLCVIFKHRFIDDIVTRYPDYSHINYCVKCGKIKG